MLLPLRPAFRSLAILGSISGLLLAACAPAAAPAPTQTPPPKPAVSAAPAATVASAKPSGAIAISGPFQGEAKALTGAGATFPAVLYSKWFNEYDKITGVQVNYQSVGSGAGIKSISDQTVDFGATDGPMTDDQLKAAKGGDILHIPMALGAVVPTYNLPGVNDTLKFTPESISGIFLGQITKWNDPKLVADNPALAQVNKGIVVVHRSDGSGTSYIFTDYLSSVNQTWKDKVGHGTSVNWPVGLGGKGNEGVSGEVKANQYSIGYVELIYALQNKLGVGLMKNKAGSFVEPKLDTVTAAAAGVVDTIAPDLRASIVNAAGATAYPISGFTWQLAYQNMPDKAKAIAVTRMLWWEIHEGQKFNADLGYAPLPDGIVKRAEEKISSVKTGGETAFPGK